jgi:hypothetical protein
MSATDVFIIYRGPESVRKKIDPGSSVVFALAPIAETGVEVRYQLEKLGDQSCYLDVYIDQMIGGQIEMEINNNGCKLISADLRTPGM